MSGSCVFSIIPEVNEQNEIIGYLVIDSDGKVLAACATIEEAEAILMGYISAKLAIIDARRKWAETRMEELQSQSSAPGMG